MKSAKEINELSGAIESARQAFWSAVEENLKESGNEYNILCDDEDGLRLSINDGEDVHTELIDKVRWDKENNRVEYHLLEYDFNECDHWYPTCWLGRDDIEYLYDCIDWEGEDEDIPLF